MARLRPRAPVRGDPRLPEAVAAVRRDRRERVRLKHSPRLLVAVAVAYLIVQLLLFDPGRPPSWDEAIYLSQVAPDHDALHFAASRSRGITLLVAPALATGASLAIVRAVLAAASAAVLLLAFRIWIPVSGLGAGASAFVFGFSWIALFYGSEAMPNLWTALAAVAAAGVLAGLLSGRRARGGPPALAAALAVMAVFRPPDAIVLAAALGVALIALRRARGTWLVALVAGPVVGALPWFAEVSLRAGDPIESLRSAASVAHVGAPSVARSALQYLALTDGPLLGPEVDAAVPIGGVLWLIGLSTLAILALVRERGDPRRPALVLAAFGGLALAAEYLFLVEGLAPRFLLPAFALLSIPAGIGLVGVLNRRTVAAVPTALVGLALASWVGWQGATAARVAADAAEARDVPARVGTVLHELARGAPCAFAASESFPQISWASGCRGRQLRGEADVTRIALAAETSFIVVRGSPPPWSVLEGLPAVSVDAGSAPWHVYELAGSGDAIAESATGGVRPSPASP